MIPIAVASMLAQALSDPLATALIGVVGMAIVTWLPLVLYTMRAFGRTEAQIANLTEMVGRVATDPNIVRWSEVTEVAVTRRTRPHGKRD